MFSVNAQSGIPIYRQILEQLRRLVASGQLQPGDELPSVRELALLHAVNPMTISKAYSLAEAEGLLSRQRGRPMTVAEQNVPKENKAERMKRLQPAIQQLVTAARQLNLNDNNVLNAVRQGLEQDDE